MTNPTDINMIDQLMARDWCDLNMSARIDTLTSIVPGAPESLKVAVLEAVREIFRTGYYAGAKTGLDTAKDMRNRILDRNGHLGGEETR